jgi:hypothetical protein
LELIRLVERSNGKTLTFNAVERGDLYMNTLRMEEFARGVEMLKMQNKNEFDHLQDYVLLANAV